MSLKSHKVLENAFQIFSQAGTRFVKGTAPGVNEQVAEMHGYEGIIFMKLQCAMREGHRVTVLALYFNRNTAMEIGYAGGCAIFACRPDEKTHKERDEVITEHQNDGHPLNAGTLAILEEIELKIRELGGIVAEHVKA